MSNPQTNYVDQHPNILFGGGHSYSDETVAADLDVEYGTLMSINNAGKMIAFDSSTAEAPPLFIWVNKESETVVANTNVNVLSSGGVYAGALKFANESDALDTMYEGKRVIDHLREKFIVSSPSETDITC